uniref:Uncharacterized protein LOC104245816 n=1 Tax=Nicotiana sylvestris TaxID=4096 RepID=A0A1U7Y6P6_NICSY|nr:PREDICTED: uncharacterized protein LOC104245816 [Nicotiana sylvestris]
MISNHPSDWDISNFVSCYPNDMLDDGEKEDEMQEEIEKLQNEQDEKEWDALCVITDNYGLQPTRGMSVYEKLGMFLIICAHGAGNRLIQEIFQYSGETIHRHFHSVLKSISELARDIIRPHLNYNDGVGDHKPYNRRYLPFFKDCIGALDSTHVKARLSQGQEIPYIGRKGYPTQNILVVVDFNMCFTFAWAGWEGATHDSRIFGEALRRSELNFPHSLGNKYYLVDAGYPHMKGYMAPYKGADVRYHLADFRRGATR